MAFEAEEILKSLDNAVLHAYLLCGQSGSYKEDTARRMALKIMGKDLNTSDLIQIAPEKDVISIDAIRQLLERIKNAPLSSNRRVIIIKDADKMTQQAQNALLKSLEEPLSSVFLLLSDKPEGLLPTINSRCLKLFVSPGGKKETSRILSEKYSLLPEKSTLIANLGPLGVAEKWVDASMQKLREDVVSAVRKLFSKNFAAREQFLDFLRSNIENIHNILDVMLSVFRDMLARKKSKSLPLINTDFEQVVQGGAKYFTSKQLSCMIERVLTASMRLYGNANLNMETEAMLLEILEVSTG